MTKQQISYTEALHFVWSKRKVVDPNPSFRKQLEVFEACEYDIRNPNVPKVEGESCVDRMDGIYKDAYLKWEDEE